MLKYFFSVLQVKKYRNKYFNEKMKMRAFSSQSEFNVFFPKSILTFQFWTFLKMSIFIFGADFFSNFFKQYILLNFELKDSLSYFLNNIFLLVYR